MRNLDRLLVPLLVVELAVLHLSGPAKSAGDEPWTSEKQDVGYVVFEHSPMKNLPPTQVPAPDAITRQLSCTLARDECDVCLIDDADPAMSAD